MELIKFTTSYAFVLLILFGCTGNTDKSITEESTGKEMIKETQSPSAGTVMLIVRGKTELSEEEVLQIAKERKPQFEAIPGLIQKYYIKTKNPGEFGGVYIWDSTESLKKYKESDLATTIVKAYKIIGPPSTEIIDIMFELRE